MSKSSSRNRSAARKARVVSPPDVGPSSANRSLLLVIGIGIGILIMGAALLLTRSNQQQAQPTSQAAVPDAPAALPESVSVSEASRLRDSGAYMLDVRTDEEWADFHMPGSVHIPLDQLSGRVAEVPRDQQIVVVCRSGNRSQQGRDVLREAGFTSVTSMAGGLTEWRSQGLPTESGE